MVAVQRVTMVTVQGYDGAEGNHGGSVEGNYGDSAGVTGDSAEGNHGGSAEGNWRQCRG